jgi:hypothetical protein
MEVAPTEAGHAAGAAATAVVMFSGGSDSTLTAIRVGVRHEHVRLLTFTRCGLLGREHVEEARRRLCRFFGDPGRFSLEFVKTDRLCRHVMYERYARRVLDHGFFALSQCGLCKVSFHWRAIVYCLDNGITHIADGAVRVANVYPEQNETILLRRLRRVYAGFGIEYDTPIYEEGDRTEQALYDLRFNRTPKVKGTRIDKQLLCEQQVLYAMFLRTVLPRMPFEEFERRMAALYDGKLDMVEEWTREYVARGPASRLARMIEM